ncbi:MAG: protein-glutamate O-methyltransferase CheR [Hyphomicrobiaceae bacterium]|nr:protein-glutamate O-methyltransferase CheR [Hyphomicrobiaceae bacterium]MCC0024217.1 protein-glutamate O-methyltransferase CheR [Hyphomicrobiaceae bacterium]
MNEHEMKLISDFALKQSGIVLNESKAYLIESRLGSIAEKHRFNSIAALARGLATASMDLQRDVIDALTTNETFFFRDKTPFNLFEEVILPTLISTRPPGSRIRIWCAATSTGQEPYSLAMLVLKHKHLLAGRSVDILATDISASALERAREGLYSQFEVQRGLPVQMLMEHFVQEGSNWRISRQVRDMVRFSELNLMTPFPQVGVQDVVYCRNVLIYFNNESKRKVLDGLAAVTKPDGYLVLGAAETMIGHTEKFMRADGQRGLYQPAPRESALRLRA